MVVVKYNAGNVQSVLFALQRLGITASLSDNTEEILKADKIIFPGVGEASSAMKELSRTGLTAVLRQIKQPFLGICLGLQLMCRHSEEGDTNCLNIFEEDVKRFNPHEVKTPARSIPYKVPHTGWNTINTLHGNLFKGISENSYVYYVHSYYAETGQQTCATTGYINSFSAALMKDNYYAVQFHPEKSGETGNQIIKNFLDL